MRISDWSSDVCSSDLNAGQSLRDQPEDGRQVEEAYVGCRSADWAEGSKVNGAVARGRGDHRCFSQAHTAAAGRLPLCTVAHDPTPDALFTAPLPAAPRRLPAARGRRRDTGKEEVQALPDRPFPPRYRRGEHGRGQALPLKIGRAHVELRLCATARKGHQNSLPAIPAHTLGRPPL